MPVSLGTGTLDRRKMPEEQRNLAEFADNHTDMSKATEESSCSLTCGDSASWASVYKPTTVSMKYESRPGIQRYMQSLKHLLPVRVHTGPGSLMPVDASGCCAFTFFSWLTPLVVRTFQRGLVQSDLYQCSPEDSCQRNGARLSSIWERHVKKNGLQKASLSRVLFQFVRTRWFLSCLAYMLCMACGFIGPTIFMRYLLQYLQSPEVNQVEGYTWMVSLIISEFVRILFFGLMWAINVRTAVRARSAVTGLLYRKILRLRSVVSASSGEIINLFSNDCQKVFMMVYNAPLLIGGPIVIVGAVIYTWWLIGPFCLASVGVYLISYAYQFGISYFMTQFRKQAVKATDERVSLMTEFLNNIKLIKLYAWETMLIESVRDARSVERCQLEKCQYLHTLSLSIAAKSSVIATVATIVAYTLMGHDLTPAEAFTIVIINTIAGHGIQILPLCIKSLVNGRVALSRLQVILHLEERESYLTVPTNANHAVTMSKATLDWEQVLAKFGSTSKKSKKGEVNLTVVDNEKTGIHDEITPDTALVTLQSEVGLTPALVDINFVLPKGKLVGVCGAVGSGKSSLIAALLGQMRLLKGHISVKGSIAYVSQEPWILNATLRENILFGQLFSSKRYYEAVYCCGLTDDIAVLPGGDQTEIGEKGVTLSGGQKQRTSLARAQYADKELYLLDNPLSAVDSQVGQHIFQHCIKGALRGKSILFVTHCVKYLQECDSVIVLREGRIVEQGTHEELMSQESEYRVLVQNFTKNDQLDDETGKKSPEHVKDLSPPVSPDQHSRSASPSLKGSVAESLDDAHDGRLVHDEKMRKGDISWDTYMSYIQAAGGFIICALVLVWFILQGAARAFSKYWLSYWLSQGDGNITYSKILESNVTSEAVDPSITANPDLEFYQLVYGLSVVVMLTISVIFGFFFTKTSLRASSQLHDNMLLKVFHSPIHFFDTTPSGRILNLFTRDADEIDNNLPPLIVGFLQRVIVIIFTLLLVIVVYHWFVIPLLFLGVFFVMLHKLFRAVLRDLKRLENVSRSPVLSHISAMVQGLPTIRAFQKQEEFYERFTQLVDHYSSPLYLHYCSIRWLGTRMDLLCVIITIIISVFVVHLKGEVDAAFAALALTLALQMSGMYQYIVRLGCDLETKFTSVERIQSCIEDMECEAPSVVEKYRPSPDWPTRGKISFIDVKMRYRPGLPLALKGLSFDIEPGEKIGIVGRTGSGKSSIGAVLFRLVELQSGSIFIDGVNIKDLGLEDLRSRLSVIPQDPVLFKGTIRYNLDPLNEYEDTELWSSLERTHMKDKISSMDRGLESQVVEGGMNFSIGEKQLLCMARALLKQSKIILLDEATCSVDNETDRLIEKTVQQVFADSTVLTIAHRLSTVSNCDRVMVVSDGKIVEFEEPGILMKNKKSAFYRLMTAAEATKSVK